MKMKFIGGLYFSARFHQSSRFLPALWQTSSSFRNRTFTSFTATDNKVHLASLSASFPYVWLRDNCQCSKCIHPSSLQKLHRSSDINVSVRPNSIQATQNPDGLDVQWVENGVTHSSFYDANFLKNYSSRANLSTFHHELEPIAWSAAQLEKLATNDLSISYTELSNKSRLLSALNVLRQYGILFVRGVPTRDTSDSGCELRVLAGKIGEIRNTFYGEVWDVRNVRHSKNIAYTNLDLDLHMDLLYYQNPPRYQILHCLRNRVVGGQSIFVDGLFAANKLYRSSPDTFKELAMQPVHFHYINDGHHLHCAHRTIELEDMTSNFSVSETSSSQIPPIKCLNYSPPFQAPLPLDTPSFFYTSLAEFAKQLTHPETRFEFLLEEGDAVIFDNRRVLHGRKTFSEGEGTKDGEGEVNRWLKGCYLDDDAVWDKRRVTSSIVDK